MIVRLIEFYYRKTKKKTKIKKIHRCILIIKSKCNVNNFTGDQTLFLYLNIENLFKNKQQQKTVLMSF